MSSGGTVEIAADVAESSPCKKCGKTIVTRHLLCLKCRRVKCGRDGCAVNVLFPRVYCGRHRSKKKIFD